MDRRAFLGALAALIAPCGANAQPLGKLARIGYLQGVAPVLEQDDAFRKRLRELGWIEGQNIIIEYRYADGKIDRLAAMAAELVQLNVDVIVTSGTTVVGVAREATATIPIVMVTGEPVSTGLVASLARPGGNITGLTHMSRDLLGKRFELLKQIVPDAVRVAALLNPTNPGQALFASEMESSARALTLQLKILKLQDPNEFDRTFAAIVEWQARGLLVLEDPMFTTYRARLADLAIRHRLPAVFGTASYVKAGGLMSYGANFTDLYRRAAPYVDKILKGAKPGTLPIEQPIEFELAINLTTAKAIGVTIPQSLLLRADEVIR
jgi:putative tryptophan/tyrosine transport system substrate-binding protein